MRLADQTWEGLVSATLTRERDHCNYVQFFCPVIYFVNIETRDTYSSLFGRHFLLSFRSLHLFLWAKRNLHGLL